MAKFVFPLQGILNLKQKLEDQARAAYGIAVMKLGEEEEKLNKLYKRKEDYLTEKKSSAVGSVNVKKLIQIENALKLNDERIEMQKAEVKIAEAEVEKARETLNFAIQERKTYEKLKEKAFDEFKAQVNYEEQMEINELVSYRFGGNT